MPPPGRPPSRHLATTSEQLLPLRSVHTGGGTVGCPKGYGLPTPSTSPTARSAPCKLPLEEKTTTNTFPEFNPYFSAKTQQQKRVRSCFVELPFSLSQVHPDDVRDKVFVAIIKALIKLENQPSSPRELSNCILQNRYVVLGGATPYATVSSRISQHFKRATEARPQRQPLLAKAVDDSHARKLRYYLNPDAGLPHVPPPKLRDSERPLVESTSSAPGRVTPSVARKRTANDFFMVDAVNKKPSPAQKKRKSSLGRPLGSRNGINSKSRWASSSPSVAPSVECLRRSRSETVARASPTPDAFVAAPVMPNAIYSNTWRSESEDDTWRTVNSSGGINQPSSPPVYAELAGSKEEADVSRNRSETPKPRDPNPTQNSLVSPPRGHVALRNPSCEPETDVFASRIKLENCHYLASTDGTPNSQIRRKRPIPGLGISDYSSEMMKTDLLALGNNRSHLSVAPVPGNPENRPQGDARDVMPLSEDCMQTPHGPQAGLGSRIADQNGDGRNPVDDGTRTGPLSSGSSASSLPTPGSSSCLDDAVFCQTTSPAPTPTIYFNNLQLYRNDPTLAPPINRLLSPRLIPTTDIGVRILGPTSPLLLFSPRSTSVYGDLDESAILTTTDISGGLDLPLPASVCSPEMAKLTVCPEVGKYHSYISLPEPNHPETVTVGELDRLLDGRNSGCLPGLSYLYNSSNGRLRTPRRIHPPSHHTSHSLANAGLGSGLGLGLGLGLGIGNHVSCCSISPIVLPVALASPLRVSHKVPHPQRNHWFLEPETETEPDATCGGIIKATEEAKGKIEKMKEEPDRREMMEEAREKTEERKPEVEERKEQTDAGPKAAPCETEDDVSESAKLGELSTPKSGRTDDGSVAVRRTTNGTSTSAGNSRPGAVAKSSASAPTTRSATASRRVAATRSNNAGSAGDDDEDDRKRSRVGRTMGTKEGKRRRRRRWADESEEDEEEEEVEERDEETNREAAEQEKSKVETAKGAGEEKEPAQVELEGDAIKDSRKKRRGMTCFPVCDVEKANEKLREEETADTPSVEEASESTRDWETDTVPVAARTEPEVMAPNDDTEEKTPKNRDEQVGTAERPPEEDIRQPISKDLPFSYSPLSPTRSHHARKEARARRNAAMAQRRSSLVAEELAAAKVALAALESTVAIQESSESESDYESESKSDANGDAVRAGKESQKTENKVDGDSSNRRLMTEGAERTFVGESSSFASAVLGLVDLSAAGNSSRHRSTPNLQILAEIGVPDLAEADVTANSTASGTVSSLVAERAAASGARNPSGLPPSMPGTRAPPVIPTRIPTNPNIYLTLIGSIPVYVTHITRTTVPALSDEEDENHQQNRLTTVPASSSASRAVRANAQNLRPSDTKNETEHPVHVTFKLLRRVDSGYVNATTLLEAGGMDTEQERSIVLSLEVGRIRVRKQGSELYGTWIPLQRGRALAATCSLQHRLGPFLNDNLDSYFPSPLPIAPSPMITALSVLDPVASHHLLLASTGHKESMFRCGALRNAIGSQNPMLGEAPRLVVNAAPSGKEKTGLTAGSKPQGIKMGADRSGKGGGNSDEDTDTDTEVTEIRRRRDLGLEPLIRRSPMGNHRRRRASTSGGTAGPARKKRVFIVHGGKGETGGLVPLALAPARRKPYYTHSSVGDESSEHESEEGGETVKNKSLKGSSLGMGRKRAASGSSGRNKQSDKATVDVRSTENEGGTASTKTTAGRGGHSRQSSRSNFPIDGTRLSKESSSSETESGLAAKRQKMMSGQGRTVSVEMGRSGTKHQVQLSPIPPILVEGAGGMDPSMKETTKKNQRKKKSALVLSGTETALLVEEKKKKQRKGRRRQEGEEGESELDIGGSDGDDDLR